MTEQDLLDLKKEIEEAKGNQSKLEGRKEALLEQLQKDFGVKTIAAANKKAATLHQEITEWENKIKDATEALELQLDGTDTESTQ